MRRRHKNRYRLPAILVILGAAMGLFVVLLANSFTTFAR